MREKKSRNIRYKGKKHTKKRKKNLKGGSLTAAAIALAAATAGFFAARGVLSTSNKKTIKSNIKETSGSYRKFDDDYNLGGLMFTNDIENKRNNNKNTKKFPFQVAQLSSKKKRNVSNKGNIRNEVPGIAPGAKKVVVPKPIPSKKDGIFAFFTKPKETVKRTPQESFLKEPENKLEPKESKNKLELKNNIRNQISKATDITINLQNEVKKNTKKNKSNKLKIPNIKNKESKIESNNKSVNFQPRKGCKLNEDCKSGSCNTNPKCVSNSSCKCLDNNFNRDFKNVESENLNLNNSKTKYPKNADKFWGLIKHEKLGEKTLTRNEFLHFLRLNDHILKKKDLVFTKYDINTIFNNTSKISKKTFMTNENIVLFLDFFYN